MPRVYHPLTYSLNAASENDALRSLCLVAEDECFIAMDLADLSRTQEQPHWSSGNGY